MPKATRHNNSLTLDAALCYAARGWQVFPARFVGNEKKSYKSAKYSNGCAWGKTTDADEVRRDFKRWPQAGIGIATGAYSKFFVVETDTVEGHGVDGAAALQALEAEHGLLPETLMAESPTGSVHRYFKHPGGVKITNATLMPGVDVKGDGGMVIAPPSERPGKGTYRWLNSNIIAEPPDWLLTRVTASNEATSTPNEDKQADIEQVIEALALIPNDDKVKRDAWITIGMATHAATAGSADGLAAFQVWSRRHEDYNEGNTALAWKGFKPKRIGAGTLIYEAKKAWPGWEDDPDAETAIKEFAAVFRGEQPPADKQPGEAERGQPQPPKQSSISKKATRHSEPDFKLDLLHGANLAPKKQEWLWPGRIPFGTLSLLISVPDMGKSHIFLDICARVTTGNNLPPNAESPIYQPRSVLIVCTEDRVEYTLVPRLMAAKADMQRVHILRCLRSKDGNQRGLDLTQDVQRIKTCLDENTEIALIVFDPISEFLGAKIDGHSNTAVRAVLGQLMDLLDKSNVAALGVSHLPKVKSGAVQTASIGSIGFSACARSSLLVVDEEEPMLDENGDPTNETELTGRKLLTVNKGNLAAPEDRQTLAFRLEPATLPMPHDNITVARVAWDGVKEITAQELWRDKPKQQSTQKTEAIKFIKQAMRDPKQPSGYRNRLSTEIEKEADAAGISATTLKRAKNDLGVRSEQEKGIWSWIVPDDWGPGY